MPKTIYLDKLLRLTLTRKGKAIAKHPLLREGAVEAIKADDIEPLWTTIKADSESDSGGEDSDADWYGDFAGFIASTPDEEIPESWEEAFSSHLDTAVKAGGKKKNYADSKGPFAGPHNSFPISSQSHVYAAARLIGHAANPGAVRARIISIARSRGYSLPKSWQSKASKAEAGASAKGSMDKEQFDELVARLGESLKGLLPQAATTETEKAAPTVAAHNHMHPHSTMRGYGYEHMHQHPNANPDTHDTDESAHAHTHVAKAGVEESPEAVAADLAGMEADRRSADAKLKELTDALAAKDVEHAALVASLQSKDAELTEKAKAAEAATAAATATQTASEAVKAELVEAEKAAKQPLIAAPPSTTEKAKKPIKDMSFDDAFATLLHS